MSLNVIFVAGVHGVGKTTYCKELSEKLQIPHFSASDIIRSQKASALEANTKEVKDAEGNQDLLIKGLEKLNLTDEEIILDGHFVLIQNDELKRLPFSTFKSLNISKVLLLHDLPEKILQRINLRDNTSKFTVELIYLMQKLEIEYAEEVSKLLNIRLEKIQVIEFDSNNQKSELEQDEQKLQALREALIDGENSGDSAKFDIETFLNRMEEKITKK